LGDNVTLQERLHGVLLALVFMTVFGVLWLAGLLPQMHVAVVLLPPVLVALLLGLMVRKYVSANTWGGYLAVELLGVFVGGWLLTAFTPGGMPLLGAVFLGVVFVALLVAILPRTLVVVRWLPLVGASPA